MNNIEWTEFDDEDPDDGSADLVGFLFGKYVDVTSHYQGTWSVMYNNVRVKDNFLTREDARQWAESADLVDALSSLAD